MAIAGSPPGTSHALLVAVAEIATTANSVLSVTTPHVAPQRPTTLGWMQDQASGNPTASQAKAVDAENNQTQQPIFLN